MALAMALHAHTEDTIDTGHRGAALLGAALLGAVVCACEQPVSTPVAGDSDAPLPAGRACTEDAACQSGYCIELAAGRACAALCVGTCPAGLACKRADGRNPASASICVRATSRLCQVCIADSDCGAYGDLCLAGDTGFFCGLDCSETQICPEGFSCAGIRGADGQEISRQCVPDSGTCTCTQPNDGLRRPCQKTTPGVGTCEGEETCVPGSGWMSCDARTPQPEDCDRQDDDCDGQVDEDQSGVPLEVPCGYGPEPRRQECIGTEVCQNGIYSPCSTPAPAATELSCDGLDDDCDGEADEGWLGGPNACSGCTDVCPPGPAGDAETVRSCATDSSSGAYYCAAIACREPHFDVDGIETNGCEITDDHDTIGSTPILNDAWYASFRLGAADLECKDGNGQPPGSTSWFVPQCDLRIPSDYRQHVPAAPPSPNVDYLHFFAKDTFFPGPVCEPDTWVCAFFGSDGGTGQQVEVCGSAVVADLGTAPTFPTAQCNAPAAPGEEFTDCCWVVDLDTVSWVSIPLTTTNGGYFYVRLRTLGAPYGGTYALAAYDWSWDPAKDGYDACPLGLPSLDPCSY